MTVSKPIAQSLRSSSNPARRFGQLAMATPRMASKLHTESKQAALSGLEATSSFTRPAETGRVNATARKRETWPKTRLKRFDHGAITRPLPRLTFRAAARHVLDDYRMNPKRSLVDVQRHVRLHLDPFFGRRRMAAITTADMRRYVARRQGEGAKNATINRELAVLKRALTLAIAEDFLPSRPRIPLLREDNVRHGFFEAEKFEAVRSRLPADLADCVSFLHVTGWRWRSEAARLRWTSVDFDAGEIRLDPGTTKTGEGRVFPFTTDLRALLERRRAVTRARESCVKRMRGNFYPPYRLRVGDFRVYYDVDERRSDVLMLHGWEKGRQSTPHAVGPTGGRKA